MEKKGNATFYSWEEYGSKFSVGKLHFKHFPERVNEETGETWEETSKFWYLGTSPFNEKKGVINLFFAKNLKEEVGGDEESFWALVESNLISVVANEDRKDIRLSLKA